jgi:hypothetical protein
MKALDHGEPVPVKIDDKECIVVQKHVFERLKNQVFDDMSPREAYPAVLKVIDKDDENPDQYLDYLQDS